MIPSNAAILKSFSSLSISLRTLAAGSHAKNVNTASSPCVPKVNGYALFLKETAEKQSEKISKSTIPQFAKDTASKWKALGPSGKEVYTNRAKEMHAAAMAEFMKKPAEKRAELENEAREAKKKLHDMRKRREAREAREASGRPKVPASSFVLFVKEKLSGSTSSDPTGRVKALAQEWRGLDSSSKGKYKAAFDAANEKYKIELKKWEENQKAEQKQKKAEAKEAKEANVATPKKKVVAKK